MTAQQAIYTDAGARQWDSGSQVTAMDNEGIDLAVLFPSRGLFTLSADGMEPALATAISRGVPGGQLLLGAMAPMAHGRALRDVRRL